MNLLEAKQVRGAIEPAGVIALIVVSNVPRSKPRRQTFEGAAIPQTKGYVKGSHRQIGRESVNLRWGGGLEWMSFNSIA